jgi:hypothetical protein
MIEIVSPAPFLEARALFERLTRLKPPLAAGATYQLAGAKTFGLLIDGKLAVVIGFWPLGGGAEECFLIGLPAEELAPFMLPLARAARLILAGRLYSGTRQVVGRIASGHVPGRRLARIAGFSLRPVSAPGAGEEWELSEWAHSSKA